MLRLAVLTLIGALGAAPALAAEACPPGWSWNQEEANFSCSVTAEGRAKTESEAKAAIAFHQDLAAIAYSQCSHPIAAPSGSQSLLPEAGLFHWTVTQSYRCKLPE